MHDFHFGCTGNIWKQPSKVLAQKTDLFRRNDFYLHAPIKNAVKTGFSQKSTLDTQLCLKRRRT
jgi:hypothetical protein